MLVKLDAFPTGDERATVAAAVAAAIDDVVEGPLLVVGSLPPTGRDLDLLAQPADATRVQNWLGEAGFAPWGHTWARPADPRPYAVQLLTTEAWRTRRDDGSVLFDGCQPVPGTRHLVIPGPASVLLLAARTVTRRRGVISDKARRRACAALDRDPTAWDAAEHHARDLGMVGAVRLLRRAYETDRTLPRRARATGMVGVLSHRGPLGAKTRVLTAARPRRIRPAIVSFSGLDGSGKTTQITHLQHYLGSLGVSHATEWGGSFKYGTVLRSAFPLLNRPTGRLRHGAAPVDQRVPPALYGLPLGRQAWVYVVVALNAVHLWRLVLRHRRAGVLIMDRFTPDSTARLDLHFRRSHGLDTRWQRRLFTFIAPSADVGFLVQVSADVAFARRQEQTPEELTSLAELYREQVPRFDLRVLDGTEAADVLARRAAVDVWSGPW